MSHRLKTELSNNGALEFGTYYPTRPSLPPKPYTQQQHHRGDRALRKQHSTEELDMTLEIRFTIYSIIRLYKSFFIVNEKFHLNNHLTRLAFLLRGYARLNMVKS